MTLFRGREDRVGLIRPQSKSRTPVSLRFRLKLPRSKSLTPVSLQFRLKLPRSKSLTPVSLFDLASWLGPPMPPRKRPPANSKAAKKPASGPWLHLPDFLHYLDAECGMSQNTIRAYSSDLQQFFEWFREHGPRSLRNLRLEVFSDYLNHLHQRKLAATSIARHLVSIKMFFRYLELEGVVLQSAVDLLGSPKLWQHLPKVLSPDTVNRLLEAPNGEDRYPLRDRALLKLLYATGCRTSEATNLRLRDVHLDEDYCRCTGKGNKERIVSLNPVARRALEAYPGAGTIRK